MVNYGVATAYPRHSGLEQQPCYCDVGKVGRDSLLLSAPHAVAWA